MGILPLRFQRVILAVAYLVYLMQLPVNHYAHVARQESTKSLLRNGVPCWIADLNGLFFPSQLVFFPLHLPGGLALDTHVVDDVEDMRDCLAVIFPEGDRAALR
jgi:hypothetical protein